MEKEIKIKILLLGESGVGKSSILQRFTEDKYTHDFTTTLGVDYKQKKIITSNGTKVLMQIWDTAGQERFNVITPIYYQQVDGVIFVYDVQDTQSLHKITKWVTKLKEHRDIRQTCMCIIGNKTDIEKKVVKFEEAQNLASQESMINFQSSAKLNININEAFIALAEEIIKKRKETANQMNIFGDQLNITEKKSNKKCCY